MSSGVLPRFGRFLARPLDEKRRIVTQKVREYGRRISHGLPLVRRMEPGFIFVVWNDAVRDAVLSGEFEKIERQFVGRFLRANMTVLDVGAYFGIYALTASVKVGPKGRVIAFEPCEHQLRKLRWNLFLNRCGNVRVENLALSSADGRARFFVATTGAEGFSGLRRPEVGAPVRCVEVRTATLDNYLEQNSITTVDLIKVDVEGGEVDFFQGAQKLLARPDSPVILCELQDIRAMSWGRTARQTADFLREFGYRWFRPLAEGSVAAMSENPERYEGNFIAVPRGRMESIKEMIRDGSDVST